MADNDPVSIKDAVKALLQAVKVNSLSLAKHDDAINSMQKTDQELQQQINDLTRKLYRAGILKHETEN